MYTIFYQDELWRYLWFQTKAKMRRKKNIRSRGIASASSCPRYIFLFFLYWMEDGTFFVVGSVCVCVYAHMFAFISFLFLASDKGDLWTNNVYALLRTSMHHLYCLSFSITRRRNRKRQYEGQGIFSESKNSCMPHVCMHTCMHTYTVQHPWWSDKLWRIVLFQVCANVYICLPATLW